MIQLIKDLFTKDFPARGSQCSKEKANTVCWGVAKAGGPWQQYYFQLPQLKDNEVRVKILHSGLCHSDCSKVNGSWLVNAKYPLVPGHEIIGRVEKIGLGVTRFVPGDLVAVGVFRDCCGKCEHCYKGRDNLCYDWPLTLTYDPYLGGYSTYLHVRQDFVYSVPKTMPAERVAPLLCAGVTVYSPLKKWGAPGLRCGVVGIGGLGHLAIQIATKMGMSVVAVSSTPDKELDARHFGAEEFVNSENAEQMKWLGSKGKLDIIINTAYVHDLTRYMYCLNPGGTFIQAAIPDTGPQVIFDHLDFLAKEKIFAGVMAGNRVATEETLKFCNDFAIYPAVETYSWKELPKAFEKLNSGRPRYRCVVDVAATFDDS